jgi:hypothetical protein
MFIVPVLVKVDQNYGHFSISALSAKHMANRIRSDCGSKIPSCDPIAILGYNLMTIKVKLFVQARKSDPMIS